MITCVQICVDSVFWPFFFPVSTSRRFPSLARLTSTLSGFPSFPSFNILASTYFWPHVCKCEDVYVHVCVAVSLLCVWALRVCFVTVSLPWGSYWARPSSAPPGWTLTDCALIFPQGQGSREHTNKHTQTSRLLGKKRGMQGGGWWRWWGGGNTRIANITDTMRHRETTRMITWLMSFPN